MPQNTGQSRGLHGSHANVTFQLYAAAGSAAGPRETVTANEASASIQPMRLPHTRDTDPGTQRQTRQTTRTTNRTTATSLNPDAAAGVESHSQPSSVTILSQQNVANRTTVIV